MVTVVKICIEPAWTGTLAGAAGPFTAAGYKSPFEHISPLMMWVIIFLGLATAGAGLMMIFVSLGKLKIKELPLRGGSKESTSHSYQIANIPYLGKIHTISSHT